MPLPEKRFKWRGDPVTGDLISKCLGCGDTFDGRHSEVRSWEAFHVMTCDKEPVDVDDGRGG